MEYFYGSESSQYSFYRIPKALFDSPRYSKISTDAKLLYGLMLDRLDLSMKNSWYDEAGRAFIYFKRDDIMAAMKIGHNTASKLMQELEEAGLIERRRQGLGLPPVIYVGRFVSASDTVMPTQRPQTSEKRTSGRPKSSPPDVRKSDPIYRKNQTEENNTENLSDPPPEKGDAKGDTSAPAKPSRIDKDGYAAEIKSNIDFEGLCKDRPEDREIIEGYIDLMSGVCSSHRQQIKIAREDMLRSEVRRQLLALRREHIEYVLDAMAQTKTQIVNVRAYTLAALYNAPSTIATWRTNKAASRVEAHRNDWMNEYI